MAVPRIQAVYDQWPHRAEALYVWPLTSESEARIVGQALGYRLLRCEWLDQPSDGIELLEASL